ncbi:MAG: hypothetical protein IJ643_08540 [Eubacterium sp.]|nr:hypothetical protein [Eubacterium sp.]MBR1762302.1 hypothetical protein [Eubacterium sp.]
MKNQERILDLISNKKYKYTSPVNSETFAEMAIRLCESKNITTTLELEYFRRKVLAHANKS